MAQLNKKRHVLYCMGCGCELAQDHTGIMCLQSHAICPDCSKNFVSAVMEEPTTKIPVKCMTCKTEVITSTFERQLNEKQLQTFLKYHMQFDTSFLAEGEKVVSCPFCGYWEINITSEGEMLFYCQSLKCKKVSCFHCKKDVKKRRNSEIELDIKEVEDHFECAALAKPKEIWDKALQEGAVVTCPECGIGGMKNNGCTHMTCPKCLTVYCYVCGITEKKLNKAKAQGADTIMLHNEDWKTNPKRCPMWLDEISKIDNRWPEDSDSCVMFFHQMRTKQKLQEAIKQISSSDFASLCRKYNVHQNCGFDLKDVSQGDHVIIKR